MFCKDNSQHFCLKISLNAVKETLKKSSVGQISEGLAIDVPVVGSLNLAVPLNHLYG